MVCYESGFNLYFLIASIEHRRSVSRSPTNVVDLIKAKFESRQPELTDSDSLTKRTRSEEPTRPKPQPSKLDKLKFEPYDKPTDQASYVPKKSPLSESSSGESRRSSSELGTGRKTPPNALDKNKGQEPATGLKNLLDRYEKRSSDGSKSPPTTSNRPGKSSPTKREAAALISQLRDDNAAATDSIKRFNEQVKSIFEKPGGEKMTRKNSGSPEGAGETGSGGKWK